MNLLVMKLNTNIPLPDLPEPLFSDAIRQLNLSAEDTGVVRKYSRDGYVVFDAGIPSEVLSAAAAATQRHCFDAQGRVKLERLMDAWMEEDAVRQIAAAPKVRKLLELLYQREPVPFQTLNFPIGTQQKTHSDTIHFSSYPPRFMCGVWVALEDVDADNGALLYYAGSHKLPIYELFDTGRLGSLARTTPQEIHYGHYERFIDSFIDAQGFEKRELHMKKGQALVWAANLFHGGSPIRDKERTRLSQVTHYYFSDCIYYTPLLSDPYIGRLHVKPVIDIRTKRFVPSRFNGKKVSLLHGTNWYGALRQIALRAYLRRKIRS